MTIRKGFKRLVRSRARAEGKTYAAMLRAFQCEGSGSDSPEPPLRWTPARIRDTALAFWNAKVMIREAIGEGEAADLLVRTFLLMLADTDCSVKDRERYAGAFVRELRSIGTFHRALPIEQQRQPLEEDVVHYQPACPEASESLVEMASHLFTNPWSWSFDSRINSDTAVAAESMFMALAMSGATTGWKTMRRAMMRAAIVRKEREARDAAEDAQYSLQRRIQ